jgi:hypothetical protein
MKFMLRVLALVTFAVLLAVSLGQAGPKQMEKKQHGKMLKVYGQIESIDAEGGWFTITVNAPDHMMDQSPLTISTSADTQIKQCEESSSPKVIGFEDLEEGHMVKISGEMDGEMFLATRIIMY